MTKINREEGPIAVLGATGYVGGRLITKLLQSGYRVRAGARNPEKLSCRPFAQQSGFKTVEVDVMDSDSLQNALEGCQAAFYLVHSMQSKGRDYSRADEQAAWNMVCAADEANLKRIIYLGGLGDEESGLSEHLISRLKVGRILQKGHVPTTFLRAAIILGSGSASFEMLRYLVDRLPVMITPKWVQTQLQPIAISNVVNYLAGCLEVEETEGQTYEIGGPDVLTYKDLFDLYAQVAGLRQRLILNVPFLSPKLSSYWIHMVTPIPASIAGPLVLGLKNTVVCKENRIRDLIPQELLGCKEAMQVAVQKVKQQEVDSCWSDAGLLKEMEWAACGDADYAGGTILALRYRTVLRCPVEQVWSKLEDIGGGTGWYYADFIWRLRGVVDRLLGGIGTARGRRSSQDLAIGDALDFWRVLDLQKDRRLQLQAEMKLPGEAILEFDLTDLDKDRTELVLTSKFLPRGLSGLIYWYIFYPAHKVVFKGMLKGLSRAIQAEIEKAAERMDPFAKGCLLSGK